MARLGDVCSKGSSNIAQKDLNEHNGDFPIYGASGLIKKVDFFQQEKPYIAVVKDGAGIGRVMKLSAKSSVIGTMQYIIPNNNVDIDYLMYAMEHMNLSKYFTGATIPHIYFKDYQKEELPLPLLDEQRQIAAVLDKVSYLIDKRRQQLDKLDLLIKSKFVEMFGTFPKNEKNWSTGKIRDVINEARYGSSRPAVDGGKYPYLRMNNITYGGELDLSYVKQIDVPESELSKCTVKRGDILFNRTNSRELVGKTCVYDKDEKMVLAGFVIRVRVNERVLPEFLSCFLNTDFSKQMLFGMCKSAIGQANINAQEMQNIDIYIPPIELQRDFVAFKNQIREVKSTIKRSLEKLETLKKALMQQYFG